jgi:hypothetical protein
MRRRAAPLQPSLPSSMLCPSMLTRTHLIVILRPSDRLALLLPPIAEACWLPNSCPTVFHKLTRHPRLDFDFRWCQVRLNFVAHWSLTRPSGVRSRRTRFVECTVP